VFPVPLIGRHEQFPRAFPLGAICFDLSVTTSIPSL
jgi:hypothetical protein